jgi:hypothetical protein
MNECKPGKHKFEPRYDRVDSPYTRTINTETINPKAIIEALKDKIYIYDICVRCGKTVRKDIKK